MKLQTYAGQTQHIQVPKA